jgi:energy-coupling factor transporter ATP-binding protein EcfA2
MLNEVQLEFGTSAGQRSLTFSPGSMTIFVGPNNSGKSLALREIHTLIVNEQSQRRIISRLGFGILSEDQVEKLLLSRKVETPSLSEGAITVRLRGADIKNIHLRNTVELIASGKGSFDILASLIGALTISLDGKTRLTLTQSCSTQSGNHTNALIWKLFNNKNESAKLRNIISDAFGFYLTIDPTQMTKICFRVSSRPPIGPDEDEWALDERGRRFFQQAALIEEFSDGIKAFIGVVATVVSEDYRVIIIDEPEAFLHPPLVRKLGKKFTELASERSGNVFAATHSADFLMGCVQAGKEVNIVRLTYKDGIPSARLLSAQKLQALMRDPLLRSTRVLSALFHEGAVVCEADRDRAFYQEINERLLAGKQGGTADSAFLNAQNKSTVKRIIQPLREMGIPAAAVVDIDILNDKPDFKELLNAAFVPADLVVAWGQLKGQVYSKIRGIREGIMTLDEPSKEAAQTLLDNLAQYGLFVVPVGEVEDWLSCLNMNVDKKDWLPTVFELMGSDPDDNNYVKPSSGDVWDFVKKIANWITDPKRKGIPA